MSQDLVEWARPDSQALPPNPSWTDLRALKRACHALLRRLRLELTSDIVVRLAVGRHHPGLRGLAASYQDAYTALALGRQLEQAQPGLTPADPVYCLDDLGIAAFVAVADQTTKRDLAKHLLSPLQDEPVLISTLEAFFANDCSARATATTLGIHRNTLAYRLAKIASLTGLDPSHFDDAVQIRLALLLRSLPESAG